MGKGGRGTRVTLHLKEADPEGGLPDYTQPALLAQVVKAHSDFVAYPIIQEQTREEMERDDQGQPVAEGKTRSITEDVTLNSMRPIWIRPQAEVTDEEYAEFYHHISHDWQPPLKTVSLKAEGRIEYSTLLFIPSQAAPNLHYVNQDYGLQLYVKRVLIMEKYDALLPRYLRFIKGIVDSSDLPLNISRQRLQEDRHIQQIRQWIGRQVLDALATMQRDEPEDYARFWQPFGSVLKEGVADPAAKETTPATVDVRLLRRSREMDLAGRLCQPDEGGAGGDLLHHGRFPGAGGERAPIGTIQSPTIRSSLSHRAGG